MLLNRDRHQRMHAGIVMIEAPRKALAFNGRQIEFELIGGARRGIGPHRMAAIVEVWASLRDRQDTRGAVEKLRKLGDRDRVRVIERARRNALTQQLCERRECFPRCRMGFAQIDLFAGPTGPHCRKWRKDTGIGINAAERIGVPAFRAARMKEKIVEVPKDDVPVALLDPQPIAPGIGLEKDPTVEEQSEKLEARKVILLAQLL